MPEIVLFPLLDRVTKVARYVVDFALHHHSELHIEEPKRGAAEALDVALYDNPNQLELW